MAVWTQISKVSEWDRKHATACSLYTGEQVDEPKWDWVYPQVEGYCRACEVVKATVDVNGTEYNNWPGGRIETRRGVYVGEEDGIVFSVTHEGLTICSRERNYHDDSDFYALVWDPTEKAIREVSVGTTRFGGTDHNSASADLADEHKADYAAFLVERQIAALKSHDKQEWREAAYAAVTPGHKGQTVRVVKGRKTPIGFEGVVIWAGEDNYGKARLGIRSADGDTQFTAASNTVVVIDPDDLPYEADFTKTDDEYRRTAEGIVWFDKGLRSYIASTAPAGIHIVA